MTGTRTGKRARGTIAALAATAATVAVTATAAAPAGTASQHRPSPGPVIGYYLALGGSLSRGVQRDRAGASLPTSQGYPDQLYSRSWRACRYSRGG